MTIKRAVNGKDDVKDSGNAKPKTTALVQTVCYPSRRNATMMDGAPGI
jgi:hypothetical protein